MTISVTSTEVQGIIEVDSDISLTPFIEVAVSLVTEHCSSDDYTSTRLNQIALWLSAHFYTVRDPRAEREKAGSVSEKFQSKVDLGFDTSHYGQMAMRLDTEGGLAALNEQIKRGGKVTAGVTWLGTADPTDIS